MKDVKIQVKDLSFRYDSRDVLKNVSFEIYDKDIVTIIGPNGGGKSTLLKLLLGILKPDSGTILIDGVPPKKLKMHEPLFTEMNTSSFSALAMRVSPKKQEVSCLPSSRFMFDWCYFSKLHLNLFSGLHWKVSDASSPSCLQS